MLNCPQLNVKDLTYDKSTLVQVMAWCRQATGLYLSQCWPRSMSPNGVIKPQATRELPQTYSVDQTHKSLISKEGIWSGIMNHYECWCKNPVRWLGNNLPKGIDFGVHSYLRMAMDLNTCKDFPINWDRAQPSVEKGYRFVYGTGT